MPPDFWAGLPKTLVWTVGAIVAVILLGQRLSEAHTGWAKLFGPLGRYWSRRAEQRKTEELQRDQHRIDRAVQTALERLTPVAFRDLERKMKRQDDEIARQDKRLQRMETTEDLNTAYLIEDAKWHVQVEIELAEQGPRGYMLPKRLSYTEFSLKYRGGWRPE